MSDFSYQLGGLYQHTQTEASTSWVVQHNLNRYPVIDVFITYEAQLQKILPASVTYNNSNQCTVTFSSPRTGYATVA